MFKDINYDSQFFGSAFGLVGAGLISGGLVLGFIFFFVSNIFFIHMAMAMNLRPFFFLQVAFTLTSVNGIYLNYF